MKWLFKYSGGFPHNTWLPAQLDSTHQLSLPEGNKFSSYDLLVEFTILAQCLNINESQLLAHLQSRIRDIAWENKSGSNNKHNTTEV